MKNLKTKMRKQGGFTLVEMLIVVAIIAILVAISIPLVNQSIEKTRDATDQANERAAKAEAVLVYLGTSDIDGVSDYTSGSASPSDTLYYDAVAGRLTKKAPTKGYGKCTVNDGSHYEALASTDNGLTDHTDAVLQVSWTDDGIVKLKWTALTASDEESGS